MAVLLHLARRVHGSRIVRICTRVVAIVVHLIGGRLRLTSLQLHGKSARDGRRADTACSTTLRATAVCHVFYPALVAEVVSAAQRAPFIDRIIVTCPFEKYSTIKELTRPYEHQSPKMELEVVAVQNAGRDVLPFFHLLHHPWIRDADLVLKIHSKRSPHLVAGRGDSWRTSLLEGLSPVVPSRQYGLARTLARTASVSKPYLVWPARWAYSVESWGANRVAAQSLSVRRHRFRTGPLLFPAGTMFWCNQAFLKRLAVLPPFDPTRSLQHNESSLDGTLAHSLERVFGQLALEHGSVILTY